MSGTDSRSVGVRCCLEIDAFVCVCVYVRVWSGLYIKPLLLQSVLLSNQTDIYARFPCGCVLSAVVRSLAVLVMLCRCCAHASNNRVTALVLLLAHQPLCSPPSNHPTTSTSHSRNVNRRRDASHPTLWLTLTVVVRSNIFKFTHANTHTLLSSVHEIDKERIVCRIKSVNNGPERLVFVVHRLHQHLLQFRACKTVVFVCLSNVSVHFK